MGLGTTTVRQASSKRVDLFPRQSTGCSIGTNQFRYAWNLQHLQAVAQCKPHKDIPWEQRKLQFYPPVSPPPHRSVEGQEMLDRSPHELFRHSLFVICTGVRPKPMQL